MTSICHTSLFLRHTIAASSVIVNEMSTIFPLFTRCVFCDNPKYWHFAAAPTLGVSFDQHLIDMNSRRREGVVYSWIDLCLLRTIGFRRPSRLQEATRLHSPDSHVSIRDYLTPFTDYAFCIEYLYLSSLVRCKEYQGIVSKWYVCSN